MQAEAELGSQDQRLTLLEGLRLEEVLQQRLRFEETVEHKLEQRLRFEEAIERQVVELRLDTQVMRSKQAEEGAASQAQVSTADPPGLGCDRVHTHTCHSVNTYVSPACLDFQKYYCLSCTGKHIFPSNQAANLESLQADVTSRLTAVETLTAALELTTKQQVGCSVPDCIQLGACNHASGTVRVRRGYILEAASMYGNDRIWHRGTPLADLGALPSALYR